MTDKVQKIIAEIKDRILNYQEYIDSGYNDEEVIKQEELKDLLNFIDTMQKEPKECMYSKDNYTAEDRKALCEGCEEECEFNKKEKPVSKIDFEQELYKYFGQVKDFTLGMRIAKRFYEIGRNYQEPVSEDLEQAAADYENNMWEAGHPEDTYTSTDIIRAVKFGANWQKQKDSIPVSEDLEQAIDTYLATYWGGDKEKQDWPFLKKMAIHFANWQKEQLLVTAVDAVVKVDAGGYPYIDRVIELYDYEKDIPLAKRGDKYKVILIKE